MLYVEEKELEQNLDFYIEKAETEDICVTKNGDTICCIINSRYKALMDTINLVDSLDVPPCDSNNGKDIIGEEIIRKHNK